MRIHHTGVNAGPQYKKWHVFGWPREPPALPTYSILELQPGLVDRATNALQLRGAGYDTARSGPVAAATARGPRLFPCRGLVHAHPGAGGAVPGALRHARQRWSQAVNVVTC
jgi:hypothetical protein